MERAKAILSHVLLTSLGVVVGGFILFMLKGGMSYLPRLDGELFPTVRADGDYAKIDRDATKACFSLPLVKIAPGVPVKDQFFVEASFRNTWLAPVIVDAYLADNQDQPAPADRWKDRYVGEHWTKRWCFEIPEAVADIQRMRVTGYAVHARRPFFNTETPLPSFVIPATTP